MVDPKPTELTLDQKEFWLLCSSIGYAMFTWQTLEKAHFGLFLKMLDAPRWEVCSAAYHSVESFEARHRMVGRMAHYFMKGKEYKSHRDIWSGSDGGLEKEIKEANINRNKLAHYGLEFDVTGTNGDPDRIVFSPRMRPMNANLVDRLIGRTRDKPEHDLNAEIVDAYAHEFDALMKRLLEFVKNLPVPQAQDALSATEPDLSLHHFLPTPAWKGWRIPQTGRSIWRIFGSRSRRKD